MSEKLPSVKVFTVLRWPAGHAHFGPVAEEAIYAEDDTDALAKLNASFQTKFYQEGYKPGDVVQIKRPDNSILREVSIFEMLK